ncbi:MAG: nucleoside-diphosphate kinase [Candidatus Sumerlaeota bacterium]
MDKQQTLVLLKPDTVRRGLAGEIIHRFERKGLRIAAMRMLEFDDELVERHYAEHVGQWYFERLEKFIKSGPVIAMVLKGDHVIELVRTMMGKTDKLEARPGTIRGDYAFESTEKNLVHGSDSEDSARREIAIFFDEDQIFQE